MAKATAKAQLQAELREESRDFGIALQSRKKLRLSSGGIIVEVIALVEGNRTTVATPADSSIDSTHNSRHVSMQAYASGPRPKSQSIILGSNETACDAAIAKMVHGKNFSFDFG